jgi:hypothetical protein
MFERAREGRCTSSFRESLFNHRHMLGLAAAGLMVGLGSSAAALPFNLQPQAQPAEAARAAAPAARTVNVKVAARD